MLLRKKHVVMSLSWGFPMGMGRWLEKTIIMIAHRLKTVRHADQIVVIDKGKIVQQGKHDELMKRQGIYKDFVNGRKQAVSWKIA